MRHVAVRRHAVLLGAVWLLWALVFAWIVRPEPAAEPPPSLTTIVSGAVLFERHCASCHAADDLRPALRGGGEAARRKLELFLEKHGDSSGDEDRQLAEYLTEVGLR